MWLKKKYTGKYHGNITCFLQTEAWKALSIDNQKILWPNHIFREKNISHILIKDNTKTLFCFVASQKEHQGVTTGGREQPKTQTHALNLLVTAASTWHVLQANLSSFLKWWCLRHCLNMTPSWTTLCLMHSCQ